MLNGPHNDYGSFACSSPVDLQLGETVEECASSSTGGGGGGVGGGGVMENCETDLQSQPLLADNSWTNARQHNNTAAHSMPMSRHFRRFLRSNASTATFSAANGLSNINNNNNNNSIASSAHALVLNTAAPASVGRPPLGHTSSNSCRGNGVLAHCSSSSAPALLPPPLGKRRPLSPTPASSTANVTLESPLYETTSVSSGAGDTGPALSPAGGRGSGGDAGQTVEASDLIRLDVGGVILPRFPPEKLKTLVAFVWMLFNFILTLTSLALTHEHMPDVAPLPDIILDNLPTLDWALTVSEGIILVLVYSAFIAVILHRHRMIVLRRIFFIMGLLYMMRSVTYFVTALPKPNPSYPCAPKAGANLTVAIVARRVVKLFTGLGLSMNGQHVYCGDYIYSGHTVTLCMAYLVIREYTPRHWWPLHWCSLLCAALGVVMVLLSRSHYTVDVVVAYYVTSRLFWLYHVMANNATLKEPGGQNNYLLRLWWHRLFRYLEGNVSGPLPRHYQWPLPWPRCLAAKRPDRIS